MPPVPAFARPALLAHVTRQTEPTAQCPVGLTIPGAAFRPSADPTTLQTMSDPAPDTLALLRLTLTPGLGPILIRRAIEVLGSPSAALDAPEIAWRRIEGIGPDRARKIVSAIPASADLARAELDLAAQLGVRVLALTDPAYPPLLASTPDAPPILYIAGSFDTARDRYPLAIVGSRTCTHYGQEQTTRFARALAAAGITIVSGGARGIDTAAHHAALHVAGRTIAVLGCGLANCYPPDNKDLFARIAAEGRGAIVSELPLRTPPNAENFPARNRIISGLSLAVLVIEAGRKSGALITARVAAEDHGRDVFALPSRVDSSAAEGSLDLLKSGGALLVTHPDDILQALESPARHAFQGTHAARFPAAPSSEQPLFEAHAEASRPSATKSASPASPGVRDAGLSAQQLAILAALDQALTLDALSAATGVPPAQLRADITMLEIRRRITRKGSLVARVS